MESTVDARDRYRNAKSASVPTHKYAIGAHVLHKVGPRAERSSFKVTRHLPDGGQGLQYRIRSERDGHERVTVESTIERP
jgi:hypothetical protein